MTKGTFPNRGSCTRHIGWWRVRYDHENVTIGRADSSRQVTVSRSYWLRARRWQQEVMGGNMATTANAIWTRE